VAQAPLAPDAGQDQPVIAHGLVDQGLADDEGLHQITPRRPLVQIFDGLGQKPLNQALDALEGLAGQPDLPGGMNGWEALARQMDETGGGGSEVG